MTIVMMKMWLVQFKHLQSFQSACISKNAFRKSCQLIVTKVPENMGLIQDIIISVNYSVIHLIQIRLRQIFS